MALGTIPALSLGTAANAAVTVGDNITAFPNRDMVVAVGYALQEDLLVEVVREGVVIGSARGPAVSTPEGVGLEVNHGPVGAPQPGDCWDGFTPDVVPGDVIRVTSARGVDTMTVADVNLHGEPTLDADGNVVVTGTGAAANIGVEFRRDNPDPKFRAGPFAATPAAGGGWTATFEPSAGTNDVGLTTQEQRDIALNEASWSATVDTITETTISELGEPGGVGPGCTGTADPNSITGGLQPINIASGDVTFSGRTRAEVGAVTVTVGNLPPRAATLSTNATWTAPFTKTELTALPEGEVTVTAHFDGTPVSRTLLKDTQAPGLPTPSPAPATYPTTQSVTLNKPDGELSSRTLWAISSAAVANPTTVYSNQITVSATQTISARLVDAAGNPGAVATFRYTIGTPPPLPTNLRATAGDARVTLSWTASTGASSYRIYRNDVPLPQAVATTSYIDTGLTNGSVYNYQVSAVDSAGVESARTAVVQGAPVAAPAATAPAVPATPTATAGNTQATVTWAAPNNGGSAITGYSVQVVNATTNAVVGTPRAAGATATSLAVTGLANGTSYRFQVRATNAVGTSAYSALSAAVTPAAAATAPTVTARTPGTSFFSQAVSTTVTATFSQAVLGVGTGTFTLRAAGATSNVAASVTRNGTTNQWILDPTVNLLPDTRYTVTLTGGQTAIRNASNVPLTNVTWTFTTGPAPTVTTRTPAAGATAVSRAGNVTATFSEAVQSVTTGTFVLRSGTTTVAATVTRDGTTNRWILNPNANLAANTVYTVALTGGFSGIRDLAGNPASSSSWTFTTGA